MRDEPEAGLRCATALYPRTHKGFWSIKTAGRWSWKSKSAKECVTTHLPNQLAPKMDGAKARDLVDRPFGPYPSVGGIRELTLFCRSDAFASLLKKFTESPPTFYFIQ